MFSGYTTSLFIKIDWSDLDLFGHVNNVAFFKYIQSARVNYCELIGLTSTNEKDKLSFIVAAINCSFKSPLNYPGSIKVFTKVDWIKNSSLQLTHLLVDQNDQLVAECTDVLVVFDYSKNTKTTIPSDMKLKIELLEKRTFITETN
jgi:acyl-CoA thioester hydrolase